MAILQVAVPIEDRCRRVYNKTVLKAIIKIPIMVDDVEIERGLTAQFKSSFYCNFQENLCSCRNNNSVPVNFFWQGACNFSGGLHKV